MTGLEPARDSSWRSRSMEPALLRPSMSNSRKPASSGSSGPRVRIRAARAGSLRRGGQVEIGQQLAQRLVEGKVERTGPAPQQSEGQLPAGRLVAGRQGQHKGNAGLFNKQGRQGLADDFLLGSGAPAQGQGQGLGQQSVGLGSELLPGQPDHFPADLWIGPAAHRLLDQCGQRFARRSRRRSVAHRPGGAVAAVGHARLSRPRRQGR